MTVRCNDKTAFLGLPRPGSAELEIQTIRAVRVEGYQGGDGVLVARVACDVKPDGAKRDSDRFRAEPGEQGKPSAWVTYRNLQKLQRR